VKEVTVSTHSNDGSTWSTKLRRIRELAEKDKTTVFNNLGHIIDTDFLVNTFQMLDGNKALGMDRISKEEYGYELGSNVTELLIRIRRGTYRPRPSRIVKIPNTKTLLSLFGIIMGTRHGPDGKFRGSDS
jgi:hypothetical protein